MLTPFLVGALVCALPLASSAASGRVQPGASSALVGCYSVPIKTMEEGFEIRRAADASYSMVFTEGKNSTALPMKLATPQEIQQISSAFGVAVTEGISMKVPADTPNQRPVGLYKGRDPKGKEVLVAYFFFDAGTASKRPCK
jgi:hypothetical protein